MITIKTYLSAPETFFANSYIVDLGESIVVVDDLPVAEQKTVWATHYAPDADLFNQKLDGTAWKSKPSWYIVATKDRTVQPEFQRFVAKRMGAKTYEVESSHVAMLSKPQRVVDVIRTAANAPEMQPTHT